MKHLKTVVPLLLAAIAMGGCEKTVADDATASSGVTVDCYMLTETVTRGIENVGMAAKMLTFAALDGNKNVVAQQQQSINADGGQFGQANIDLQPGKYTLVVFAHNAETPAEVLVGGVIDQGEGPLGDSFVAALPVTVEPSKHTAVTAMLRRCVAKLQLKSTDVLPVGITAVDMTINGACTQYNALGEHGGGALTITRKDVPLSATLAGKTVTIQSYVYLPAKECQVSASCLFKNSAGEVVYTNYFPSFAMSVNHQSVYNGPLFVAGGLNTGAITVDTTWEEDVTIEREP